MSSTAPTTGWLHAAPPPQVLALGFSKAELDVLLPGLGLAPDDVTSIDGRAWTDSPWSNQRRPGRAIAFVKFSRASFTSETEFLRAVSIVSVSFRPQRLIALMPRVTTREVLEFCRAGANLVVPDSIPADELKAEIEAGGVEPLDYFVEAAPWLETLERLAVDLDVAKDPNLGMQQLLRTFARRLTVDRGSIALLRNGELEIVAVTGHQGRLQVGSRNPVSPETISGRVIANRKSLLLQGSQGAGSEVTSAISAPLIAGHDVLGVVSFSCLRGSRILTENDVRAAEVFARLLALSLSNKDLLDQTVEMEKLSTIGTALATVSHSLRNLLTILKAGASLASQALERADLEATRLAMGSLQSGVRRAENLVQDLLCYSKHREPMLAETNVHELLDDLNTAFHHASGARKLEIVDQVTANEMLDEPALERALLNLLMNAIDATNHAGVVRLSASIQSDKIVFTVEDNGPGVHEDQIETIFHPFYSTKGSRGTGLGLPTVRKFALECGGHTVADLSPELGGLRIQILLPRSPLPSNTSDTEPLDEHTATV